MPEYVIKYPNSDIKMNRTTADVYSLLALQDPRTQLSLTALLNQREFQGLSYVKKLYLKRFNRKPTTDRNLFVYLQDSPWKRLCWSGVSRKLPTFRTGGGKMFHVQTGRWMCARERMAALGFPVTPASAIAMGCPIVPCADVKRSAKVAGNSFHFATCTVVTLCALACHSLV